MKKNIFYVIFCLTWLNTFVLNAQFQVETNTKFKLGDKKISIYIDNKGRYHQANGYIFDSSTTGEGLALEYGDTNTGGFFVNGNYAVIWNTGKFDRLLRIYDADWMEYGNPERAYIDGDGYLFTNSDSNRKFNIKTLDSSVNKVMQLRGVQYNHKKVAGKITIDSSQQSKTYYGLVAEEVEKVLPDIIGKDEYGNLFINYSGFIPVLIQALQEQQGVINQQNSTLNSQNATISTLITQIQLLQNDLNEIKKKIK